MSGGYARPGRRDGTSGLRKLTFMPARGGLHDQTVLVAEHRAQSLVDVAEADRLGDCSPARMRRTLSGSMPTPSSSTLIAPR